MKRLIALALPALLLAAPAEAATWDIDPAHSTIGFVVKHLVVAKVRGKFNKFSGTVVINEKDITKSSVNVTIDAASIDTGNEKRDAHLRSADFFDVEKFPQLTFKSKRVKKTKGGLLVTGDFQMHGVTKTIILKVAGPSPEVKDPGGKPHIALSAEHEINRYDYGLKWNAALEGGGLTVSEEVKLELDVELKNKR